MASYLIRRIWQMIPTLAGVILLVFFLFKYFGGDPAEILAGLKASPQQIAIAPGVAPRRGADVWLVRYDPRTILVPVRAGENTGKTLPQRNVVRGLQRLGAWTGATAAFRRPRAEAGLADVVIVQGAGGGPILAAARLTPS